MHHYLRNEVGSPELRNIDQNGRTTNMPSVDLTGSNRSLFRGSRLKMACDLQPGDLAFIRATVLRQRQAQDDQRLKENLSASTPALNVASPHHAWRLDDEPSICSVSSASSRSNQNGSLSPASVVRAQQGPQYEWMEERRRKTSSRTPSPIRSPVGNRIFGYRPNLENASRMSLSPANHSRRSESAQHVPVRRSESAQHVPTRRSQSVQNVSARRSESVQNVSARRSESAQSFPAEISMESLRRPKRKDAINAHSWRRGQEVIKREIGAKKSRPAKDQTDASEATSPTPAPDDDHSAASDAAEEKEVKEEAKPLRTVRSRRRRVASTPASATPTSSSPPRHRHYDPNAVRSYLRRQRESRRRVREEQQAEEEARKARRQEQLADLHRRQRNAATASPQPAPAAPEDAEKVEEEEEEEMEMEMEEGQDRPGSSTPTNAESQEEQEEEAGLQERILALEGSANSLQLRVQRLAESLQDPGPPPSYFDRVSPIPRTRGGSLDAVSFSPVLLLSPLMLSRSMESGLHHPVVESTFETREEPQLPQPQLSEVAEKPEGSTGKLRSKSFEGSDPPRKRRERRLKPRIEVSASVESADTEDDVASSLSSRLSAENGEPQSSSTVDKEDEAARVIQKDLRQRERQLAERRRVAEEMLRWRSRLDAEEAEVRALERKALQLCKVNAKEEEEEEKVSEKDVTDGAPCPVNGAAIQLMEEEVDRPVAPPVPPPRHRRQIGRVEPEKVEKRTDGEEEPQVQPQPAPALTNRLKQRLAGGGGGLTALTLTNKPQPPVSSAPSSASPQSTQSSVSERPLQKASKQEAGGSEEEDSQSVSISETDVSEIEGRVRALSEELKRRRRMADRLKREQKRKHRERLKQKEDILQRHIEMYDKYISELQCDLNAATSALHSSSTPGAPSSCNSSESLDSPPVRPKIKSPRAATQAILPLSIPATTSSSSAADEEDEEEEKSEETVKNEEEDDDEEEEEEEKEKEKEEDEEEIVLEKVEKENEEAADDVVEEKEDSQDEDAAPTIRSELTDIPRDEEGSPAHAPRRDSVTTEAESSVWSAASDSEPEKEETEEERKASAMAEDIVSRLLSETLDLVAGPSLARRVDAAVAEWLSSALSQTMDRALPLHHRPGPETAQRQDTAPWALSGGVPALSPPAHFAGSSVSGGASLVPFRLVSHQPAAVSDLVHRFLDRLWPSVLDGSLARVEMDAEEEEEALSGAERRARAAHRSLVCDLAYDCVLQVMETDGKGTATNLLPGPSRYRVWGGTKPPTTKEDLIRIVDEAVAVVFGFRPYVVQESRLSQWTASRKREHVEELLVSELRREEPSWTDYSWDEWRVKMQTADSLLDSLISETTQLCLRVYRPPSNVSKHV